MINYQSQFNQINHLTQFNHLKKELRKINLFMQNKPNFKNAQINVSKVSTKDYENIHLHKRPKTNPIQTQSNPKQTQFQSLAFRI